MFACSMVLSCHVESDEIGIGLSSVCVLVHGHIGAPVRPWLWGDILFIGVPPLDRSACTSPLVRNASTLGTAALPTAWRSGTCGRT